MTDTSDVYVWVSQRLDVVDARLAEARAAVQALVDDIVNEMPDLCEELDHALQELDAFRRSVPPVVPPVVYARLTSLLRQTARRSSRATRSANQIEGVFAELEARAEAENPGVLDVLRVYGGYGEYDEAVRQVDAYFAALNPDPCFGTTNTAGSRLVR